MDGFLPFSCHWVGSWIGSALCWCWTLGKALSLLIHHMMYDVSMQHALWDPTSIGKGPQQWLYKQ